MRPRLPLAASSPRAPEAQVCRAGSKSVLTASKRHRMGWVSRPCGWHGALPAPTDTCSSSSSRVTFVPPRVLDPAQEAERGALVKNCACPALWDEFQLARKRTQSLNSIQFRSPGCWCVCFFFFFKDWGKGNYLFCLKTMANESRWDVL